MSDNLALEKHDSLKAESRSGGDSVNNQSVHPLYDFVHASLFGNQTNADDSYCHNLKRLPPSHALNLDGTLNIPKLNELTSNARELQACDQLMQIRNEANEVIKSINGRVTDSAAHRGDKTFIMQTGLASTPSELGDAQKIVYAELEKRGLRPSLEKGPKVSEDDPNCNEYYYLLFANWSDKSKK